MLRQLKRFLDIIIIMTVALGFLSTADAAARTAARDSSRTEPAGLIEAVNNANPGRDVSTGAHGPAVIRAQVLLDRAWYSPGEIDGRFADNMRKAVLAFQKEHGLQATGRINGETWQALDFEGEPALVAYTITDKDAAGPFVRIPADLMQRAKLQWLGYESLQEALAERFHVSPKLLRDLNPRKTFAAGTEIWVPAVDSNAHPKKAASISVVLSQHVLQALDHDGKVLAQFPVSLGGPHDPLTVGKWKVKNEVKDPVFHYNPDLIWDAKKHYTKIDIPPGPNSPIGVVWMGLTRPHDGIHGTPDPSRVGRSETHGCLHLTNWDVQKLSAITGPGTPVNVVN